MKKIFTLFVFFSIAISIGYSQPCGASDGGTTPFGPLAAGSPSPEIFVTLRNILDNTLVPITNTPTATCITVSPGFGGNDPCSSVTISTNDAFLGSGAWGYTVTYSGLADGGTFQISSSLEGCTNSTTYTSATSILPVEFIDFIGDMRDGKVQLNWKTASETNNEGFIVERSFNGVEFEELDMVVGAGTTVETQSYVFTDLTVEKSASANTAIYRLKQVDFDGNFEYSDAISVALETGNGFEINNMASNNGNVEVYFGSQVEGSVTATVFNLEGKLLGQNTIAANEGFNMVEVPVNDNLSGLYIVRLTGDNGMITKKFIK